MARKKKASRKYNVKNEFRFNNSIKAGGHPHYIFGEKNNKYYSIGITSHPKAEYPTYQLSGCPNPNPKKRRSNYVQRQVFNQEKRLYGKKTLNDWKFSADDMAIIRQIIKSYKRSLRKKK